MYIVNNKVTDIIVGKFKTDNDFIDYVSGLVKENGTEDFSVLGVSDAKEYIEEYCDNLELLDPTNSTYTISLTFSDIAETTPLNAVEKIIGWIKNDGVDDMVFDVQNEITGENFTVDMDADKEVTVLPYEVEQPLIDKVLTKIKKDIEVGDVTALEVFLKSLHEEKLYPYLY